MQIGLIGKKLKFTSEDIVELVRGADMPILSVHASRDIGSYLCSEKKRDWEKGERVIHDALSIAERLKAEVCVFHLWDTWKASFDLHNVESIFLSVASQFPNIKASVENIPTHLECYSPLALVKSFKYITMDLRWATMYKEFDAFEPVIDSIVNVHLRGSLKRNRWRLERSDSDFYDSLNRIRNDWGYLRLLTVEPEGTIDKTLFKSFLQAMCDLRK